MNTTRHILPAMLAFALAGPYSLANAQAPAQKEAAVGTSGTTDTSSLSSRSGASRSDTALDDKAIQNLLAAAQSLRESIQNLALMPAGEKRTEAIREGNEALVKVQSAMAALPPSLLTANANESNYRKSLDKMKVASDRLYAAADALANQPPGKARNEAIKKVNQALLQTNEAMLTGLQVHASNDKSNMVGSAAVTGRPGRNNVDLSGSAGNSGVSTGKSGSGSGNQESSSTEVPKK